MSLKPPYCDSECTVCNQKCDEYKEGKAPESEEE